MVSRSPHSSKLRPIQSAPSLQKGTLLLRVWPSKDFSIGLSIPPRDDGTEHPLGGIYRDATTIAMLGRQGDDNAGELSLKDWLFLFDCYEKMGIHNAALNALAHIEEILANDPAMGLSVASNSHNSAPQRKKNRRGLTGITTYQKRLIKSAGTILESEVGRQNLTFFTTTLPPLAPGELALVNANWAELVRVFIQELGRELARHGLPAEVVGVTEVQEKRFERTGQVYPHLHLVFAGRKHRLRPWAINPSRATELWCHQVERLIGRGIYRDAATKIEPVKTALKKELGKYLSKGVKIIRQAVAAGQGDVLPRCWAICTLSLRRRVKQSIVELRHPGVQWLFDRRSDLQALRCMVFREISFEVKSRTGEKLRDQVIGCAGFLSVDNWQQLIFKTADQLDSWINLKLAQALLSDLDHGAVELA